MIRVRECFCQFTQKGAQAPGDFGDVRPSRLAWQHRIESLDRTVWVSELKMQLSPQNDKELSSELKLAFFTVNPNNSD